jgi:hypothetical protein
MSDNIEIPFFDDEDEEFNQDASIDYCRTCGCELGDTHPINCPDNDSPFAEFMRNGYG